MTDLRWELPSEPISSGVPVAFAETQMSCPNASIDNTSTHSLWSAPWWDDPPANGGAVIGSWVFCRTCAYEDWW